MKSRSQEQQEWWTRRYALDGKRRPPSTAVLDCRSWLAAQPPPQPAGFTLLDLGAGSGSDSCCLAELPGIVYALDLTTQGLEDLTLPNLRPIAADVRAPLPFENCTFDLIFSQLLLSCDFEDDAVDFVIGEVWRMLRPGGRLWLVVRSTADPTYLALGQPGAGHRRLGESGLHFFSQRKLRQVLSRFEILQLSPQTLILEEETYGVLLAIARRSTD